MTTDDRTTRKLMRRLASYPAMECLHCQGRGTCLHCGGSGTNPEFKKAVERELQRMEAVHVPAVS